MFNPDNGMIGVTCDDCSASYVEVETRSFQEAADTIREDGWTVEFKGGDWHHSCPDCASAKTPIAQLGRLLKG